MSSSNQIRDKSLKTMGIFALLIAASAALLTRYLLAPIRKVTEIASSEAMQSLGTLSRTSREARDASTELASAAQETQRQVTEVNNRTSKVNADVTDVAVAIEELSSALETVSRSVEKTTSLTEVSASKAEIASMAGEDLSKAAADIAGVVTLIEEIARQTKLLSINAGIEAANAGQWGTGFKVLSGEIGKLAARTTQSTTEIAAQIDAVTSLIQKSLVANQEISSLISEVNDQTQNISSSTNEQKKATEQIAERMRRTMTNVEVSNNNLQTVKAASERSAASAEQLLAGVGEVDSATKSMGDAIDRLSKGLREM
ncbi:MAG: methyl-accepting chemotaxis protein [Pseudomonadota bacterium]|nr:methyl-accepting chemotaxis protein [Pseudomonadota bacterium]